MSGRIDVPDPVPVVGRAGVPVRVAACRIAEAPVDRCPPDDLAAADGLPAPRAAERLAARGLLRRLLAETTDGEAAAAPLRAEPSGRPVLAGHPDLAVSLSHADGWVAAAVGRRRVGVDVQPPRSGIAAAGRPRSARRRGPCRLPDAPTDLEAAWIWSVQEACVKATGDGLAGLPWRIPVAPGAVAGRWGGLRWAALRAHFPLPVSCAWDPGPGTDPETDDPGTDVEVIP
ncbi:hypothetical protein [Streptomyces sp. B6B3]|uniref:4'-phosphopantetheinyl transferase family protein n=1 Tax=Streptomyces sp. B6B3 TaxID=3153570 RepID=UPI00325DB0AC